MATKKFTSEPIGLGLTCSENEEAIMYIWNDLINRNLPLNSFWDANPIRLRNITARIDRNLSLLERGDVIENNHNQYQLSDSVINKCLKYLYKQELQIGNKLFIPSGNAGKGCYGLPSVN